MGRPKIDPHRKIRELLSHTRPSLSDATPPIDRYEERLAECGGLLQYLGRRLTAANYYDGVYERHMTLQRRMTLVTLIEGFERFLKDLAIVCVDHLAAITYDDRFDCFSSTGTELALHFGAGDIGKAMCESETWLSNNRINERFRRLLKSPFGEDWSEQLFPNERQRPDVARDDARTLAILWQVRHSITHNSGVLTEADAARLRLFAKQRLECCNEIAPSMDDIRHVTRFLKQLATDTNDRVGNRLASVLSEIHLADTDLFDAQKEANELSSSFKRSLTINGCVGVV